MQIKRAWKYNIVKLPSFVVHQGSDIRSAVHSQSTRISHDSRSPCCGINGIHFAAPRRVSHNCVGGVLFSQHNNKINQNNNSWWLINGINKLNTSPFSPPPFFVSGYAIASSSDDRMNEPPTSLGLVPHQVSKPKINAVGLLCPDIEMCQIDPLGI